MATVTDFLNTVLKVVGGPAYQKAMDQAAKSADALAAAEKRAKATNEALASGLERLGLSAGGALGFAAIIRESIKNFEEDENAIFRTTILLRNLGSSYPIEKAQAFASAQQQMTGIQDDLIVAMLGTLKAFGAADSQLEALGKTILDFSIARNISLEEATNAVGHAMIGNTRILRNLGIEFKATGDRIKDATTLMQKMNDQARGASAARLGTLSGAFDRLGASLSEFFSSVGDKLSTVLVPALEKLSNALFALSRHPVLSGAVAFGLAGAAGGLTIGALAGQPLAGAGIGGLLGLLLGAGLGLLPSRPNAAATVGSGKKSYADKQLEEINSGVKKMANGLDGFLRLGFGTGTVGLRAANVRALRSALKGAF